MAEEKKGFILYSDIIHTIEKLTDEQAGVLFKHILKYVNDLSLRIDLEKTLQYAEGLYIQLSNFKNLPAPICEILGFAIQDKNKIRDDLDIIDEKLAKSNLASSSLNNSNQALNEIDESQANKSRPPL